MPNTLILTLLPNGVDRDTGRLRLSVVAGFQLDGPVNKFEGSPVAKWPTLAADLGFGFLVSGTDEPVAATRTGERPDQRLWDALFRPDSPLGKPPTVDAPAYESLHTPYSYGDKHNAATALYAEAMATSPTAPLRRDHAVAMAIAALAELTDGGAGDAARRAKGAEPVPPSVRQLLDPDRLTPDRLDAAVAELTRAGRPEAARIAPFAPTVMRHRRRTAAAARAATAPPLTDVPSADRADVQQVLGLLLDHPGLARRLGLVLDFQAVPSAALAGQPPLRVDVAQGARVRQIFDVVRTPPSRVRFDANRRLFVMATRPNAVTEIRDGMLDVRPVADGKYTVGDLDVESLSRQLQLASDQLAAGADEVTLPVRRDVGLTLAQRGRADVAQAAIANAGMWLEPPEELEGEPVLYADDVTSGYRVDVSRNGGPFRSLMRRVAEYRLGDVAITREPDLVVHDEGVVEPLVAVQQEDGAGGHALEIGEQMFVWDGWAIGAPLPGPKVAPEAPAGANVVEPDASIAKGYDLAVRIAAEPGTVTPLRYGDTVRMRARAVDLAGNSLTDDEPDSGFVTAPTRFVRHDPAAAAVIVPAHPLRGGETLTRIVARSDGDGRPLDGPAVRHLAPPPVAQRMAERHGMFDAAIGVGRPAAERDRLLAVGRMESGSFNDPVVRRPDGTTTQADGITVVAPPGTGPAATLPLPLGQALPAGQYVVHATERLLVPHLPDPLVSGVAFMPLPAEPGSTIDVSYGDRPWPDARPARLVVSASKTFAMSSRQTPGGAVIDVALPPGEELDAAIASTISPSRLGQVDPVPSHSVGHALHGLHMGLCQRQRVTVVHATRRPAGDPVLTINGIAPRERGSTVAGFSATATFHGPTTGKLDVVATWDEIIDTGSGDVRVEPRRLTMASVTPKRGTSTMTLQVRHDFGDTKRRDLQVRLVAATRFRDCFPELAEGDPLTLREGPAVPFTVTSTTVPTPLDVHSVVPTYRWERVATPGRVTSHRRLAGVRIYVERPGAVTGVGEQLGVVTYVSQQVATSPAGGPVKDLVTRWGDDPLEERDAIPPAAPLVAAFPRGAGMFAALHEMLDTPAAFTTGVSAHQLRFAADRGLWYADVDVTLGTTLPAFVRFGLVRVQPKCADRCLVSPTRTTDWIPLPTPQSVDLTTQASGDVFVRVGPVNKLGLLHRNRAYRAALQPRLLPLPPGAARNAAPIDITTTEGEVAVDLVLEPVAPPTDQAVPPTGSSAPPLPTHPPRFMIGTLRITTTDPAERARLLAGRIVVREDQVGSDLAKDQRSVRPMWLETIDYTTLRP